MRFSLAIESRKMKARQFLQKKSAEDLERQENRRKFRSVLEKKQLDFSSLPRLAAWFPISRREKKSRQHSTSEIRGLFPREGSSKVDTSLENIGKSSEKNSSSEAKSDSDGKHDTKTTLVSDQKKSGEKSSSENQKENGAKIATENSKSSSQTANRASDDQKHSNSTGTLASENQKNPSGSGTLISDNQKPSNNATSSGSKSPTNPGDAGKSASDNHAGSGKTASESQKNNNNNTNNNDTTKKKPEEPKDIKTNSENLKSSNTSSNSKNEPSKESSKSISDSKDASKSNPTSKDNGVPPILVQVPNVGDNQSAKSEKPNESKKPPAAEVQAVEPQIEEPKEVEAQSMKALPLKSSSTEVPPVEIASENLSDPRPNSPQIESESQTQALDDGLNSNPTAKAGSDVKDLKPEGSQNLDKDPGNGKTEPVISKPLNSAESTNGSQIPKVTAKPTNEGGHPDTIKIIASVFGVLLFLTIVVYVVRLCFRYRRIGKAESPPPSPLMNHMKGLPGDTLNYTPVYRDTNNNSDGFYPFHEEERLRAMDMKTTYGRVV